MLKNDFFYIRSITTDNNTINAVLELNPAHRIFEGHFPGQPVVPGVCMVQMIKEILETVTGNYLQLTSADHIKFLAFINPLETQLIQASVQYLAGEGKEIKIAATLLRNETVSLKLKGVFTVLPE